MDATYETCFTEIDDLPPKLRLAACVWPGPVRLELTELNAIKLARRIEDGAKRAELQIVVVERDALASAWFQAWGVWILAMSAVSLVSPPAKFIAGLF